jgi:oligopeptide/dipeptide ABC transporter ATP-binding protein
MYLGKVVELADAPALFRKALHPYTTALFSSVLPPVVGARRGRSALAGDVPSPVNPPSGCRFRTRCPLKVARCETEEPPLRAVGSGQSVACHVVG